MMEMFKKKIEKPLGYKSSNIIYAFSYVKETFVAIDNNGLDFISLDSRKRMELKYVMHNIKQITIRTICPNTGIDEKNLFIGKTLNDGKIVDRLLAKIEDNLVVLSMNTRSK